MKPLHFLSVLLIVAIWGLNFVAIKVGTETIPPILLAGIRMLLTGIPLIFFIRKPSTPWKYLVGYGLFIFTFNFGFLFAGMKLGMSAGLTSLVFQTQIFFTIGLSIIFFGERIRMAQIFCALLAFSGVVIIALNRGGSVTPLGLTFVLLGCFSWALGNMVSKKIGKVNMLGLVVWGGLIASLPLLVFSLLVEGPQQIGFSLGHLDLLRLGCIFFLVYPTTILGFSLWSWLLNLYSTTTLLPFTLLVPVFGIFSAVVILKESLEIPQLAGASLVFLGVGLNLAISTKRRLPIS